jgi:hypothetical protein
MTISYLRFNYFHCVDTSAGALLVPDGIICPVVSASTLTWFIKYILSKFTVLKSYVIIIKAKVRLILLPQA